MVDGEETLAQTEETSGSDKKRRSDQVKKSRGNEKRKERKRGRDRNIGWKATLRDVCSLFIGSDIVSSALIMCHILVILSSNQLQRTEAEEMKRQRRT